MNPAFKNFLLKLTESTNCEEIEIIQNLWSDYGRISRYQLEDSSLSTVVVKFINLEQSKDHPRGWNTEFSHLRKVKSYEIETHWYEQWSQNCNVNCKVPELIGTFTQGADRWIVLEDLNTHYPLRKVQLNLEELKICLDWLANFHMTFLFRDPKGLWKVGTYWHLETRPDEFEEIEHQELKSKAQLVDDVLNKCHFQTIVHGDAKLANFCFSQNADKVAAVDFQYVGGGCGMKDVAYFLGSCLSSSSLESLESTLLEYYFMALKKAFDSREESFDFSLLEKEWRKMYPYACTDFTRFMLGWMPSHKKINAYNLKLMNGVLSSL